MSGLKNKKSNLGPILIIIAACFCRLYSCFRYFWWWNYCCGLAAWTWLWFGIRPLQHLRNCRTPPLLALYCYNLDFYFFRLWFMVCLPPCRYDIKIRRGRKTYYSFCSRHSSCTSRSCNFECENKKGYFLIAHSYISRNYR